MFGLEETLREYGPQLIAPLILFAIAVGAGIILQRLLGTALTRWSERTGSPIGKLILACGRNVGDFWALLLGIYLASQAAPLTEAAVVLINQGLLILLVISLTYFAARLAGALVRHYAGYAPGGLPVTSLTENLVRWTVVAVGILILLSLFGLSIAPILTALGIGGLAVALALRDTLANLFAGFYVSLARQVRPGDYIKLDAGPEGYVVDIAWRCTTIRTLANNWVIFPNEKLAQAIVTNYSLPARPMTMTVPITVGAASDPEQVERLLVEEAKAAAGEIPGLLAEPEPQARIVGPVGKATLDFQLLCQVAEYVDQFRVQHQLSLRLLKRFRESGIALG
jgi:small-conductance mechanosensitive channel